MKSFIKIILLILILVFGYYSVVFEPNNIKIERQVIFIKNLSQSFDGIRIVQLSDFHSLWFGNREKRVLAILEEINPDFVFVTGDFVDPITKLITDRKLKSVKVFWQELGKKYQGRIFGVLGNHDSKIVKNYLEETRITILDNKNKKIFFGDEFNGVYLIGVDDPFTGRDDLSGAIKGIKDDNITKILLAHAPEIIDEAIEKNIDLILVGHTHGGLVNIPILGMLIQPLSRYGRKYTKGLFKINSTYLYVNRGIGTSVFPARFNCSPEITLIELRK